LSPCIEGGYEAVNNGRVAHGSQRGEGGTVPVTGKEMTEIVTGESLAGEEKGRGVGKDLNGARHDQPRRIEENVFQPRGTFQKKLSKPLRGVVSTEADEFSLQKVAQRGGRYVEKPRAGLNIVSKVWTDELVEPNNQGGGPAKEHNLCRGVLNALMTVDGQKVQDPALEKKKRESRKKGKKETQPFGEGNLITGGKASEAWSSETPHTGNSLCLERRAERG